MVETCQGDWRPHANASCRAGRTWTSWTRRQTHYSNAVYYDMDALASATMIVVELSYLCFLGEGECRTVTAAAVGRGDGDEDADVGAGDDERQREDERKTRVTKHGVPN